MKLFRCDACNEIVYFENTLCLNCGSPLAFLPDILEIGSIQPAGEPLWTSPHVGANPRGYRLCFNYREHGVCNEAIPAESPEELCLCCRFTEIIPDLTIASNRPRWARLHTAQRRLLYSLRMLGITPRTRREEPFSGLAFQFLADTAEPAVTGHQDGVITLALAEADDAEREKRRVQMGEHYRTLLGHFRHEVGHYYWDRLIRDGGRLERFREIFGDERENYAEALMRHHANTPTTGWNEYFISAYATSHPWEDWAETWAHYLHLRDALQTAASCGLGIPGPGQIQVQGSSSGTTGFDALINSWIALARILNTLNRSLGLGDAYPFVLAAPVVDKLRYVDQVVTEAGR